MKKRSIVNLIRYYYENNDIAFRNEAEEIAKAFDQEGDTEIACYIQSLLSNNNVFVPQLDDRLESMFERIDLKNDNLWLPEVIMQDLIGIINAVSYHKGINRFLFQGKPGTGKTEAVKQVARIMQRDVFMVNFTSVIDCKLGSTQKNIAELFKEINHFAQPHKLIILFDEIDAIALDRTNDQDHREMGRATSSLLKELDRVNPNIVLIATTNLYKHFDKALIRRFDAVIDFDRYSQNDLLDIGVNFIDKYLKEFNLQKKDIRLFRKIYSIRRREYSPGEIKNGIRSAIAFCDCNSEGDYLRRIYDFFYGELPNDVIKLKQQGFTVREIGLLTGKSKSTVDRVIRELV